MTRGALVTAGRNAYLNITVDAAGLTRPFRKKCRPFLAFGAPSLTCGPPSRKILDPPLPLYDVTASISTYNPYMMLLLAFRLVN